MPPDSNVVNPFFAFWSVLILDERKEGWGDVKRRFGGACHVCVCLQEPSLVVHYGKETLFRFF